MKKEISHRSFNRILCLMCGLVAITSNHLYVQNHSYSYIFLGAAILLMALSELFLSAKEKKYQVISIILLGLLVCLCAFLLIIINR